MDMIDSCSCRSKFLVVIRELFEAKQESFDELVSSPTFSQQDRDLFQQLPADLKQIVARLSRILSPQDNGSRVLITSDGDGLIRTTIGSILLNHGKQEVVNALLGFVLKFKLDNEIKSLIDEYRQKHEHDICFGEFGFSVDLSWLPRRVQCICVLLIEHAETQNSVIIKKGVKTMIDALLRKPQATYFEEIVGPLMEMDIPDRIRQEICSYLDSKHFQNLLLFDKLPDSLQNVVKCLQYDENDVPEEQIQVILENKSVKDLDVVLKQLMTKDLDCVSNKAVVVYRKSPVHQRKLAYPVYPTLSDELKKIVDALTKQMENRSPKNKKVVEHVIDAILFHEGKSKELGDALSQGKYLDLDQHTSQLIDEYLNSPDHKRRVAIENLSPKLQNVVKAMDYLIQVHQPKQVNEEIKAHLTETADYILKHPKTTRVLIAKLKHVKSLNVDTQLNSFIDQMLQESITEIKSLIDEYRQKHEHDLLESDEFDFSVDLSKLPRRVQSICVLLIEHAVIQNSVIIKKGVKLMIDALLRNPEAMYFADIVDVLMEMDILDGIRQEIRSYLDSQDFKNQFLFDKLPENLQNVVKCLENDDTARGYCREIQVVLENKSVEDLDKALMQLLKHGLDYDAEKAVEAYLGSPVHQRKLAYPTLSDELKQIVDALTKQMEICSQENKKIFETLIDGILFHGGRANVLDDALNGFKPLELDQPTSQLIDEYLNSPDHKRRVAIKNLSLRLQNVVRVIDYLIQVHQPKHGKEEIKAHLAETADYILKHPKTTRALIAKLKHVKSLNVDTLLNSFIDQMLKESIIEPYETGTLLMPQGFEKIKTKFVRSPLWSNVGYTKTKAVTEPWLLLRDEVDNPLGFVNMSGANNKTASSETSSFLKKKCPRSCTDDTRAWICRACMSLVLIETGGEVTLFCDCGSKSLADNLLECVNPEHKESIKIDLLPENLRNIVNQLKKHRNNRHDDATNEIITNSTRTLIDKHKTADVQAIILRLRQLPVFDGDTTKLFKDFLAIATVTSNS